MIKALISSYRTWILLLLVVCGIAAFVGQPGRKVSGAARRQHRQFDNKAWVPVKIKNLTKLALISSAERNGYMVRIKFTNGYDESIGSFYVTMQADHSSRESGLADMARYGHSIKPGEEFIAMTSFNEPAPGQDVTFSAVALDDGSYDGGRDGVNFLREGRRGEVKQMKRICRLIDQTLDVLAADRGDGRELLSRLRTSVLALPDYSEPGSSDYRRGLSDAKKDFLRDLRGPDSATEIDLLTTGLQVALRDRLEEISKSYAELFPKLGFTDLPTNAEPAKRVPNEN